MAGIEVISGEDALLLARESEQEIQNEVEG